MWYFQIGAMIGLILFIATNIWYFADESIERESYPVTFFFAILGIAAWLPAIIAACLIGPCWLIAQPIKKRLNKDQDEHV